MIPGLHLLLDVRFPAHPRRALGRRGPDDPRFLLGATAGRTTLNGEGLQHQDGHSLLLASANPACIAYDAAHGFELGHIVREALRRIYGEPRPDGDQNVFYYLTFLQRADHPAC